ncbi:MAG: DUF4202 domain-containing protein [Cyclobacteriaceae bacterium]
MTFEKLTRILSRIDEINTQDPNLETYEGKSYPKEILYSQRMTEMLHEFVAYPSGALQIAARGQHIQRWAIPRSDYPMDRKGYMKWRTVLKAYHSELLGEIMENEEVGEELIDHVKTLISKRKLKTDPESKTLEDVVCLVFLKYYFVEFAAKHPKEKVIDIVQKTWAKMTEEGHTAALRLPFGEKELTLVKEALA